MKTTRDLEDLHAAALARLNAAASASPVDEDGVLAAIDELRGIEKAMPEELRIQYVEPLGDDEVPF
jgi:hypothetical protein